MICKYLNRLKNAQNLKGYPFKTHPHVLFDLKEREIYIKPNLKTMLHENPRNINMIRIQPALLYVFFSYLNKNKTGHNEKDITCMSLHVMSTLK